MGKRTTKKKKHQSEGRGKSWSIEGERKAVKKMLTSGSKNQKWFGKRMFRYLFLDDKPPQT